MSAINKPNDNPEKALKLRRQNVAVPIIAKRLGVSRQHVYWLFKEALRRQQHQEAN